MQQVHKRTRMNNEGRTVIHWLMFGIPWYSQNFVFSFFIWIKHKWSIACILTQLFNAFLFSFYEFINISVVTSPFPQIHVGFCKYWFCCFVEFYFTFRFIRSCWYPPSMLRHSDVSFRSHIGRDVADYVKTSSRRRDWYVMGPTYLRRLCDVSLVRSSNRPIWGVVTTYQLIPKWGWPT